MIAEASVMAGAVLGQPIEMFAEAAVEAFDHAIGLWAKRPCQLVGDAALGAQPIDGMITGRLVGRLALLVDGEAIRPFTAVVGEDGVHAVGEVGKEALQEAAGSSGSPITMDLDIDVTCGPIDGDEAIGALTVERWQIFEVEMDEAAGLGGFENARLVLGDLAARRDAMPPQATMNGAA